MEPRIQYTKTADGVNIAFWTLGEGPPVVQMANPPWSHIQMEWRHPGFVRYYERLAEKRKLVRYDARGTGLSDRNVPDYSVDAHMLYLEAIAHASVGWSAGEEANRWAAHLRECTTPEAARAIYNALAEFDVTAVLSEVRSPTLILQRRELAIPGVEVAKSLASGIPGARLALLEGDSVLPWMGDEEPVLVAIDGFLGDREPAPAGAEAPAASGVCTILFTDVEGSTALTERLGDAKAREVMRNHERITREALRAHGGAEVKAMGDGFMASFSSATRALECAVAMQRAFAAHSEENPDTPIKVRIGLNAGEPIAEDEDLFGTAVIMAARIAAQAKGEEILASDVVRQLVAGKGFLFADRGEVALRGFEDPVRLCKVRWEESP